MSADVRAQAEVRGSAAELSTSRMGLPTEVPAARGTTVQNRYDSVFRLFGHILKDSAVKPDASPEEVAAVVNDTDGAGAQIFTQAVCCHVPACPVTTSC